MEYFSKNDSVTKMNTKMKDRELETKCQILCSFDLYV